MIGNHPWAVDLDMDSVGTVQGNSASGAVMNMLIDADKRGIVTGEVMGNALFGFQGTKGFGGCPIATNYAVYPPHAGTIMYEDGWTNIQFDSNIGCQPK